MKKLLFVLFAFLLLSSSVLADAVSSETFSQSLYKDAQAVYSYFHGSGSQASASAAYDRLFYLLYNDAQDYVLNTNTCRYHTDKCPNGKKIKPENRLDVFCSRNLLDALGYDPCDHCIK